MASASRFIARRDARRCAGSSWPAPSAARRNPAGPGLRHGQAQLQLAAALDHVLEDLVDRVLVDAGPVARPACDRLADAVEELRGRDVAARTPARPRTAGGARDRRSSGSRCRSGGASAGSAPAASSSGAAADRACRAGRRSGVLPASACISSSMYSSFLQRRPVRGSAAPLAHRASATPRRSRRSPRPDGSARTTSRGAARSSCCTASACRTRDTARDELPKSSLPLRGVAAAGSAFSIAWPASWRRMRMHDSASPPSTSSICASSSRARRGCAR